MGISAMSTSAHTRTRTERVFDTRTLISNNLSLSFFGLLAQLVEQRTFNPLVACSNHAQPTKKLKAT